MHVIVDSGSTGCWGCLVVEAPSYVSPCEAQMLDIVGTQGGAAVAITASSRVSMKLSKKLWHEYGSGGGGVSTEITVYQAPTQRTVTSVLTVGPGGSSVSGMHCRLGI